MSTDHVSGGKGTAYVSTHVTVPSGVGGMPALLREPRCGPWASGVCQKCGRLDPLDLVDYFDPD